MEIREYIVSGFSLTDLQPCLAVRCLRAPAQMCAIKFVNHINIGFRNLVEVNAIIFLGGRVMNRKDRARYYVDRGSMPYCFRGTTFTELVVAAVDYCKGWLAFLRIVNTLHRETTIKGARRRNLLEDLYLPKRDLSFMPVENMQINNWTDSLQLPQYTMRVDCRLSIIDVAGVSWINNEWIFYASVRISGHNELIFGRCNPNCPWKSRLLVHHRKYLNTNSTLKRMFLLPDDETDYPSETSTSGYAPKCNRCIWVAGGLVCSTDRFTLTGSDAAIDLDSNSLFILSTNAEDCNCLGVYELNTGVFRKNVAFDKGFIANNVQTFGKRLVIQTTNSTGSRSWLQAAMDSNGLGSWETANPNLLLYPRDYGDKLVWHIRYSNSQNARLKFSSFVQ